MKAQTEKGPSKVGFLIDSTITPNCTFPNEGTGPYDDPYLVIILYI